MRISDWMADVCSSDLGKSSEPQDSCRLAGRPRSRAFSCCHGPFLPSLRQRAQRHRAFPCPASTPLQAFPCPASTPLRASPSLPPRFRLPSPCRYDPCQPSNTPPCPCLPCPFSSEDHPSKLQSLLRTSYDVFCL